MPPGTDTAMALLASVTRFIRRRSASMPPARSTLRCGQRRDRGELSDEGEPDPRPLQARQGRAEAPEQVPLEDAEVHARSDRRALDGDPEQPGAPARPALEDR